MMDSLGVYISVPFCKAKCTYCNFASGVFAAERTGQYVDRVCDEILSLRDRVSRMGTTVGGVVLPDAMDTLFFGGGTPSLLSAEEIRRLFAALRQQFTLSAEAEVTLECAPGQLSEATLDELLRLGMNRISFGVQSFVDAEAKAVGRLHTREMCLAEIARMRAAGVQNVNVDLIAGLPHQTRQSWPESVSVAIESGVPHVSVYMLEVDEDSRLGREVIASGAKYGAASVASEDEIAEWYAWAVDRLDEAGLHQYEISNFARERFGSRHNEKYWRREPYVGFGLDAHSMLRAKDHVSAVRWANGDDLDQYLSEDSGPRAESPESQSGLAALRLIPAIAKQAQVELIGRDAGFEEAMFLGLRRNVGVDLRALRSEFGAELVRRALEAMRDVEEAGLIEQSDHRLRLTGRGRMVSNEVFSRLLLTAV